MLTVTLYTKKDCHLCDQARGDLDLLQDKYPHRLVEIDINSDPALLKAYLVEIPVIEIGPYVLKYPFDKQKLAMALGAAILRYALHAAVVVGAAVFLPSIAGHIAEMTGLGQTFVGNIFLYP